MPTTIHRAEDWEVEWRLEEKNPSTGQLEPLDADTPVSAWLSATDKGDPITPESVVTLARRTLELRTDARTLWFAVLAAADVTAALAGIVTGGTAYEVVSVDGELKSNALIVAD
jgi:hypothetical protein